MSSSPDSFLLPLVKKEQLTHSVYKFYFDRTKHRFEFVPGQYIRLTLPHPNSDSRGTSRFFTITSSPTQVTELILTVSIVQSTFKHALLDLPIGESVRFWGPIGQFIFRDATRDPLVFLAGGMGITPYYSMMRYVTDRKLSIPMWLFASFRKSEDVVLYNDFLALVRNNPLLTIVYTVSRPEQSRELWEGERGRITANLLRKYVITPEKCHYFVSGPDDMIQSMNETLRELGVNSEQVMQETFTGY